MSRGIILFGAMGVGDTTLGKEIARRLNLPHFDIDDYSWRWDTEIPYTIFRTKEERTADLMADITKHAYFVMSGSMFSIRKVFEPMFDLAVFMTAPAEIRAGRIRARALDRWGDRVLPGGDMYENSAVYRDYLSCACSYDTNSSSQSCIMQHEQWAEELPCPVLRIDGTKDISENAAYITAQYSLIRSTE